MKTIKYGLAFLLGAAIPCALWIFVTSAYAVSFGVVEMDYSIADVPSVLVPEDNQGWFIQNQGTDNVMIGIGRDSEVSTSSGIILKPEEWIAEQNYNGSQQHAVRVVASAGIQPIRVVYYR